MSEISDELRVAMCVVRDRDELKVMARMSGFIELFANRRRLRALVATFYSIIESSNLPT